MASDTDDFSKNIENLKATAKKSFARIYATLKARELKTLRQLDAIRKHCEEDKDLMKNCVQDIRICFDSESTLLDNIYSYGAIDFENLNFDSKTFSLEDYVKPEDDHMYSYKTIEEASKEVDKEALEIEEAALKQITATDDCVCVVNIKSDEVSRQFRDIEQVQSPSKSSSQSTIEQSKEVECPDKIEEEKSLNSESEEEVKKIDPTDDWLNSIKSQTETEPTQLTDVMEHSTITCP